MKKLKYRRRSARFLSWILVIMLLMSVPVLASAAILDPYEGGSVTVDGNLEVVSIRLDTSNMFWQRFHDGSASVNGKGSALTYSTQMRYVDNDTVSCWPFGATTYILTGGIPTGSNISVDMAIGLNVTNQSQNFECVAYLYLDTYDSLGNSINRTTVWSETQNPVVGSVVFFVDPVIDTALIQGSYQWSLTFSFDFNGVSNESDTTSVTLQCFGDNITLDVPYSQVYQLQQQGEKTNQLLDQIDKQMAANGERLDDVIAQGQANGEKLDGIAGDIQENGNKLDNLISGGQAAGDLIAGGDKIQDAGDGLGDNIGEIGKFEDIYMGDLEDNLGDIVAAADISLLVAPLSFIQRYTNKVIAAVPSHYLVVFTLPMLIGIFMYIVGHPVRSPEPDRSGDIVTRETFTTSTVLSGRNAGRSTTVRTVTRSQEIGRVHNE